MGNWEKSESKEGEERTLNSLSLGFLKYQASLTEHNTVSVNVDFSLKTVYV